MFGQETRNKLTDRWKESGVKSSDQFAILTNVIHHEWTEGLNVQEHKNSIKEICGLVGNKGLEPLTPSV